LGSETELVNKIKSLRKSLIDWYWNKIDDKKLKRRFRRRGLKLDDIYVDEYDNLIVSFKDKNNNEYLLWGFVEGDPSDKTEYILYRKVASFEM